MVGVSCLQSLSTIAGLTQSYNIGYYPSYVLAVRGSAVRKSKRQRTTTTTTSAEKRVADGPRGLRNPVGLSPRLDDGVVVAGTRRRCSE